MTIGLPALFGPRRAARFVEIGRRQLRAIVLRWRGGASYGMLSACFPYARDSSERHDVANLDSAADLRAF